MTAKILRKLRRWLFPTTVEMIDDLNRRSCYWECDRDKVVAFDKKGRELFTYWRR